jgi:CubicO group peptidase (beta-lactamase class C family)
MRSTFILILFFLTTLTTAKAQSTKAFADSIRKAYHIPELNYAVVSSDKIIEMHAVGNKKINTNVKAALTDRFIIGSNTKTITSYIAFLLVKKGKIKWDTPFFELFPELKAKSNPAYYPFTLKDFITFRANLPGWSYGNDSPTQNEIKGSNEQQRYEFIAWELQQKQEQKQDTIYFSNPSYVAAGLMLEKASGKDYNTLVNDLGKELGIQFQFGQPNFKDENQPWGHDDMLLPESPADNYKLNWLLPAGNINVSLPDYVKFIQLQLKGLLGKSNTAEEFNVMHYGLPKFSYGWFQQTNEENKLIYSYHRGNPGTFLSEVHVCKATNKAFIFLVNVQSDEAEQGLKVLFDELNRKYSR